MSKEDVNGCGGEEGGTRKEIVRGNDDVKIQVIQAAGEERSGARPAMIIDQG